MTETLYAEEWTMKVCEACKRRVTMPSDAKKCGWCQIGKIPPHRRRGSLEGVKIARTSGGSPGRVEVPGLDRVMRNADVRSMDFCHELGIGQTNMSLYRNGRARPTLELAETFALYLCTTLEDLMARDG